MDKVIATGCLYIVMVSRLDSKWQDVSVWILLSDPNIKHFGFGIVDLNLV